MQYIGQVKSAGIPRILSFIVLDVDKKKRVAMKNFGLKKDELSSIIRLIYQRQFDSIDGNGNEVPFTYINKYQILYKLVNNIAFAAVAPILENELIVDNIVCAFKDSIVAIMEQHSEPRQLIDGTIMEQHSETIIETRSMQEYFDYIMILMDELCTMEGYVLSTNVDHLIERTLMQGNASDHAVHGDLTLTQVLKQAQINWF